MMMMMMMMMLLLLLLFGVQATGASHTGHWPDWRGPTGQGHSDATGLPLQWSESENIVWKTPVHDLGYSTPVVWGGQIWLTTATIKGTILYAVCVDLN